MPYMRKLTAIFIFATLSASAFATPIVYTFDVDFQSGPLAGSSAPILVTLDGVLGTGAEDFSPGDGNMLAFSFVFDSTAFSILDDRAYPSYPRISLLDGNPTLIDYAGLVDSDVSFIYVNPMTGFNLASIGRFGSTVADSEGTIDLESWRVASSGVPVPATIAIFGLGLACMGVVRRQPSRHG
jgi:hypothetical protein